MTFAGHLLSLKSVTGYSQSRGRRFDSYTAHLFFLKALWALWIDGRDLLDNLSLCTSDCGFAFFDYRLDIRFLLIRN